MNLPGAPLLLFLLGTGLAARGAAGPETTVTAGFPGGNVRVVRNLGGRVELAPDLRDGNPWFYWQFEAKADRTGSVQFVFAEPPRIGVRGPAYSTDRGAIWQWLGTGAVDYATTADSFRFSFTNAAQDVRFCVAIPYLRGDLDGFLAARKGNPHLRVETLTKTAKGTPVDLLRIGEPGADKQAVLVTARHHACESMASYVLEGFLAEALSESPAGVAFRNRYVLYAVPLVDVDGVQAGDQGKGRQPHDHNRDYGLVNRYPEVRAVQALARDRKIELALDFHCPFLRGESHEYFYFDGLARPPVYSNVLELASWLEEESAQAFSRGPSVWLKAPGPARAVSNLPFSVYFALQPSVRMAVTLEVPYALRGQPFDGEMARDYGAGLLRAWTRMAFTASGRPPPTGFEDFTEWRKRLGGLVRSKPAAAELEAARMAADTLAPGAYRAEARLALGLILFRKKEYGKAGGLLRESAGDPEATARQREEAAGLLVRLACEEPGSDPAAVEAALAGFKRIRHPAGAQRVRVHDAVCSYYEKSGDLARALEHAREQLAAAPPAGTGRVLIRVAGLQDRLGRPDEGLRLRREAVAVLRRQLNPVPAGVFGPLMAADLYEALGGLPEATDKEKQEAADMVRNHPLKFAELIEKVSPPKAK